MESDSINCEQGAVANLISLLNTLDKIEVSKERIEQNSKMGVLNDGVVVIY